MLLLSIHSNHTCSICVGLHCCFRYRYERSQRQAAFGRSLVQRHVALPEDIANEAGEGLLVSIIWYLSLFADCAPPPSVAHFVKLPATPL